MNAELMPMEPSPQRAIAQPNAVTTPADLLAMAVSQGADLDKLEKLMALQERYEANEARRAFNVAFAEFKAEAVKVIKGTVIKDGPLKGKTHANLHDVVIATAAPLAKHGLAAAWKLTKDEPGLMEVTCVLKHADGHSESVSMSAAPDTGPGRNAIQARGSAKTYLERYTLMAILGLAASDQDDDGAGAEPEDAGPTRSALQSWIDGVDGCVDRFGLKALKEEMVTAFGGAMNIPKRLIRAYNEKWEQVK